MFKTITTYVDVTNSRQRQLNGFIGVSWTSDTFCAVLCRIYCVKKYNEERRL